MGVGLIERKGMGGTIHPDGHVGAAERNVAKSRTESINDQRNRRSAALGEVARSAARGRHG